MVIAHESTPEGGHPLFDHLVGEGEQRRRNRQAERLGDLQIDDEIEFNRLLDRQIGRLRSAQNPVTSFRPSSKPLNAATRQTAGRRRAAL